MDLRIEGKSCLFFKNSAVGSDQATDDEFEDDDEETSDEFKVSPAIKLGCSLISVGNSYFQDNKEKIKGLLRDKLLDLSS